MFHEYLGSNEYKYHSPCYLRFFLELVSEFCTDIDSSKTQEERRHSDKKHRINNTDRKQSEWDTDSKRIDTRSYSERHEWAEREIITLFLLFITECLSDHIHPDYPEEDKCNPVIYRFNITRNTPSSEPSEKWHDCLKNSECQWENECLTYLYFPHGKSCRNRYRECVHRERNRDEKEWEKWHIFIFLR